MAHLFGGPKLDFQHAGMADRQAASAVGPSRRAQTPLDGPSLDLVADLSQRENESAPGTSRKAQFDETPERMVQSARGSTRADERAEAATWRKGACQAFRTGQLAEAEFALGRAIDCETDNAGLYAYRSHVALRRERAARALEDAAQVPTGTSHRHRPPFPAPGLHHAMLCYAAQVIQLTPRSPRGYSRQANAHKHWTQRSYTPAGASQVHGIA